MMKLIIARRIRRSDLKIPRDAFDFDVKNKNTKTQRTKQNSTSKQTISEKTQHEHRALGDPIVFGPRPQIQRDPYGALDPKKMLKHTKQ